MERLTVDTTGTGAGGLSETRYREDMANADHSNRGAGELPEELRDLTYDQATPEQIAQIREHMRAKLAAADARWTVADREQQRAAFLRRLDAA